MKRLFQMIFVLILACFSFFFTEKAATILKSKDPLLEEIKTKMENYEIKAVDALVDNELIIPGLNGVNIDVDKSYENMKKIGIFNENLIILKETPPYNSINNYYDKYIISGNKLKNTISFIFVVNEDSNIDKVLEILKTKKIRATFFIDGSWIENNKTMLEKLNTDNHEIGNLGYKGKYEESLFIWTNNILKRNKKSNIKYCYLEQKNEEVLNLCKNYKYKSVIPNLIIKNEPLKEIKENISNGLIISFRVSKTIEKELNAIITYINKKGYKIEALSSHLNEKRD